MHSQMRFALQIHAESNAKRLIIDGSSGDNGEGRVARCFAFLRSAIAVTRASTSRSRSREIEMLIAIASGDWIRVHDGYGANDYALYALSSARRSDRYAAFTPATQYAF